MIEFISIGDRLKDGEYELHSRFIKAANFRYGDAMAAVVDEDIGAGPLNIVINGVEIKNIRSLEIQDHVFYLNRRKYMLSGCSLYDSQIEFRENISYKRFFSNLTVFKNYLIANSSPRSLVFLMNPKLSVKFTTGFERELLRRFSQGANTIGSGNILDGVRMIKGLGYGLTPSGDDFIAGMMCALWPAGLLLGRDYHELISRIYYSAVGGNFLANAFLGCAREGRFLLKQKALVEAILYGNEHDVIDWTKELLTIGETSGADWGTGFVMILARINEIL